MTILYISGLADIPNHLFVLAFKAFKWFTESGIIRIKAMFSDNVGQKYSKSLLFFEKAHILKV